MDSKVYVKDADLDSLKDAENVLALLNHYANDIMGGGKDLSDYVQKNLIAELRKEIRLWFFWLTQGTNL